MSEPSELLTTRERAVYRLAGEGLCPKEIAQRLDMSLGRVRTRVWRLREKLGRISYPRLVALSAAESARSELVAQIEAWSRSRTGGGSAPGTALALPERHETTSG